MTRGLISFALINSEHEMLIHVGDKTHRNIIKTLSLHLDYSVDKTRTFKRSPLIDDQIITLIISKGLAFVAVSEPSLRLRIVLAFLCEMMLLDQTCTVSRIRKHIKERMEFYSSNPDADKIRAILSDVEKTKETLHACIEKLLERNERLEILSQKCDVLEEKAAVMLTVSKKLNWREYWKVKKCIIIGGGIAFISTAAIIGGVIASLT
jgi:hypothetical protein